MPQQDMKSIEPLIEETLHQIYPILTEGLAPKQALWALDAYRDIVLPYRLGFAVNESEEEGRQRAAIAVEDIMADLQDLAPEAKWAAVRQAFYYTRILPLSYAARDLAQQFYRKQRPREELQQAAREIDARLDALVEEMQKQDPETLDALEEIISETGMDCHYVIHDSDMVSLGMKHFIDNERGRASSKAAAEDSPESSSSTCPNCGATNPPTSRFCNQCGHQLQG